VVIQFNKRDLPDTKSDEEIEEAKRRGNEPVVGAVAVRGEGVLETLFETLFHAYRKMDERAQLARNLGLSQAEFLSQIFSRMDLTGTKLAARFGTPAQGGGVRR
jgi:hypothetical protein